MLDSHHAVGFKFENESYWFMAHLHMLTIISVGGGYELLIVVSFCPISYMDHTHVTPLECVSIVSGIIISCSYLTFLHHSGYFFLLASISY